MNLIVIVADSLRYDHVGCCGGDVKTPNIDKLASESMVFDQAYAENLPTLPCRTAWWTGRHLFTQRGWQPFELDDVLLAEVLSSRGFTSALVADTYHMHRPPYNCGRGFDTAVFVRGQEYDPWITGDIDVDVTEFHRMRGDETDEVFGPRFLQYLKNRTAFKTEDDHCAPRVIKEAVHWLDHVTETARDNLFLWVDSFSPHEPWDPPEPFRSMYDPGYTGQELIDPVPGGIEGYMTEDERAHTKALYGGCVTLVDKWVGILLDRIRELGLYDNSIIMFTSDHGEPFGEHGYIRKCRPFCYDYLAHIPWIVRMPGAEPGRNSSFVQPPDLMPTALDALGFDFSGTVRSDWAIDGNPNLRTELTGTSILPVITGEKKQVRDCAVSAFHGRHWSIRTEEWTLLKNLQGEKEKLLFNRSDDPAEKNNLVDSQPEVAEELEEKLDTFADRMHTRTAGKD